MSCHHSDLLILPSTAILRRSRRQCYGVGGDTASVSLTGIRPAGRLLNDRKWADELLTRPCFKAGVITTGPGGFSDEHVVILQCVRALAEYGVEPRHLRAFLPAPTGQSDLIAQIVGPLVKAGNGSRPPTTWPVRWPRLHNFAHVADQVCGSRRSSPLRTRLRSTAVRRPETCAHHIVAPSVSRTPVACAEGRRRW